VALINNYINIIKLLLENKANIVVINQGRLTPLNTALINSHVDIIKLFLENGANIVVIN